MMAHTVANTAAANAAAADPAREFLGELARRQRRGASAGGRRSTIGAFGGFNGGFAGGKRDRLTDDWDPGTLAPNTIHRAGGALLRDRARDLIINNPLAESAVGAYIANVVECGIAPKPLFDDADRRRLWLDAWNGWGGMTARNTRESDVTAQQTTYELLALWLEEVIVAGGCLLHFVELPRGGKRRLPLALELIPEERFADDLETPLTGTNRKTANPIRRGVEVDSATGRPLAYWVRPYQPNDPNWDFSWEPIRIPAEQCEYAFFRRRIGQSRGYSLLASAILWLWKLGYYADNELMNSAVRSCFSAMITSSADEDEFPELNDDDPNGPAVDAFGNLMEKLQPAMIFRGRPGEDIKGVGPNTPGADASPWLMLIERSIGVGMGLSYEELCRDFSQGSFSSVRAAANADRRRFRRMQKFAINHFCNPVYNRFSAAAVRAGLDGFPSPNQFLAEIDDWLRVAWMPPGWASVNPLDDAQAATIEITHGLATRAQYIANKGGDWEETFEQLDREQSLQEEYGLVFAGDPVAAPAPGESPASQRQAERNAAAPPAGRPARPRAAKPQ